MGRSDADNAEAHNAELAAAAAEMHAVLDVGYCGNCPWVDDGTNGGTKMPPSWSCLADYDYETGEELEGYGRPLDVNQSPPPEWCRLRKAPVIVQLRLPGGRRGR